MTVKPMTFVLTALGLLLVATKLNPSYEASSRKGFQNTSTRGVFKEGTVLSGSNPNTYKVLATDFDGNESLITIDGVPPFFTRELGPFSVKDNKLVYGTQKDADNSITPRNPTSSR